MGKKHGGKPQQTKTTVIENSTTKAEEPTAIENQPASETIVDETIPATLEKPLDESVENKEAPGKEEDSSVEEQEPEAPVVESTDDEKLQEEASRLMEKLFAKKIYRTTDGYWFTSLDNVKEHAKKTSSKYQTFEQSKK